MNKQEKAELERLNSIKGNRTEEYIAEIKKAIPDLTVDLFWQCVCSAIQSSCPYRGLFYRTEDGSSSSVCNDCDGEYVVANLDLIKECLGTEHLRCTSICKAGFSAKYNRLPNPSLLECRQICKDKQN